MQSGILSGSTLETITNTTTEDAMDSLNEDNEESYQDTLKRHMSLSASVDPFDDHAHPIDRSIGGHFGRARRRARPEAHTGMPRHSIDAETNLICLYA